MSTEIETNHFLLKQMAESDADLVSSILSCPTQTKYLPNEAPYSERQIKSYLTNRLEHWERHGFGTFVIALKEHPKTKLGFIGVEYTPDPSYVDIRFALLKKHEGQGCMTEASKELTKWFFETLNFTKLYGAAMYDNLGSKAVLLKLGMEPLRGVDFYKCKDLQYFQLNRRL